MMVGVVYTPSKEFGFVLFQRRNTKEKRKEYYSFKKKVWSSTKIRRRAVFFLANSLFSSMARTLILNNKDEDCSATAVQLTKKEEKTLLK